MKLSILLFFFAVSCVLAKDKVGINYQVVVPGATNVEVLVEGVSYPLARLWPDVPYFTGRINETNSNQTYKYVADGVQEPFDRIFPSCKTSATYNDFYGRELTIDKMLQLSNPFTEKGTWIRGKGPNGVFDDDYISTVFFIGEYAASFLMNASHKYDSLPGFTIVMINRDDQGYFENVTLNIEDTSQLKPNMKFKLQDKYHSGDNYKLRPSVSDPVFMRDKLYIDTAAAIGVPHAEATFARVYVNDVGLGFFNLQQHPGSKDFIESEFYGQKGVKSPKPLGVYMDCTTGADFAPDAVIDAFVAGGNTSGNVIITTLIDALAALDTTNTAAIDAFSQNWFDVDYFFRAIILEYLTGSYDSYWFLTTNFVVFNDNTENTPTTNKFYFIGEDFDQTFGTNLSPIYDPYGDNITKIPYTAYVNKYWAVQPYDAPHRVMVDKLLSNVDYKAKFEQALITTVKEVWNPIALGARIDAIAARIRPELEWDYGLGVDNRAHHGNATARIVWTIDEFDTGFEDNFYGGNWPLKTWIEQMSNTVATEFGFSFTNPANFGLPTNCSTDDGQDNSTGHHHHKGTTGFSYSTANGYTGMTGSFENDAIRPIISIALLIAAIVLL